MAAENPVSELKRRIEAASERQDAAGDLARELLPLVKGLTPSVISRPTRGTGEMLYRVERTQQGEVLSELRVGGSSKPYRCPKAVYEAVAKVLTEADRPLLMDEIVTAVTAILSLRPPDFQVRLPLRFWIHMEPPLVARNRARYAAAKTSDLKGDAQTLWAYLWKDQKSPQEI